MKSIGSSILLIVDCVHIQNLSKCRNLHFVTYYTFFQLRSAYRSSHLSKHVSFSIDPSYVTAAQESTAVDGVHYSIKVSQVLSQMIANGYLLQYPSALPAKKKVSTHRCKFLFLQCISVLIYIFRTKGYNSLENL